MPEPVHAKLSASGSAKWLRCPASIRLEEGFHNTSSEAAEEGTRAHDDAEKVLLAKMKLEDSEYDIEEYINFVFESRVIGAELHVEQRLAYTNWVKAGFGTADAVIVDRVGNDIHIIDLKYGKGVRVEAEDNSQLRLYALGALQKWLWDAEPDTVTMTIVQPRLDHVSTEQLSVDELLEWGEKVKELAKLTENPDAKPVPGTKQCQWCLAKFSCRVRVEKLISVANNDVDLLSPREVGVFIPVVGELAHFAKGFTAHAQEMAESGTSIPGYKLVEGRSVRKFVDGAQDYILDHADVALEDISERKMLGIIKLEKVVGKDVIKGCVIKPDGKPTLVPVADKRPELNYVDDFPEG